MSAVVYLSEQQTAKLRAISKTMVNRSVVDLANCAIDEAILDWEKNNSSGKGSVCSYCRQEFNASKEGGGHKDDCPERIPF